MSILNHFQLEIIEITLTNGEAVDTSALVYGSLAITPNLCGEGYSVTHVPTGRGSGHYDALEEAATLIAFLNGLLIDWEDINNLDPYATMADIYGERGTEYVKAASRHWVACRQRAS